MTAMPSAECLMPDPEDLHEHMISQLDFLRHRDDTISWNSDQFKTKYYDLRESDPENWCLNIDPNWIVPLELPDHIAETQPSRDFAIEDGWAVIGGKIKVTDNQYKDYALHLSFLASEDEEVRGSPTNGPCCWKAREEEWKYRVAKQYHFDIDPGRNKNEPKPVTHLQSGGNFKQERLPANLKGEGIHYCSSPLDKPRLVHPPMVPILLFQIISEQYGGPGSMFSEHWDPMVVEAESMLWAGYYGGISEHLEDGNRSDPCNTFVSNSRIE